MWSFISQNIPKENDTIVAAGVILNTILDTLDTFERSRFDPYLAQLSRLEQELLDIFSSSDQLLTKSKILLNTMTPSSPDALEKIKMFHEQYNRTELGMNGVNLIFNKCQVAFANGEDKQFGDYLRQFANVTWLLFSNNNPLPEEYFPSVYVDGWKLPDDRNIVARYLDSCQERLEQVNERLEDAKEQLNILDGGSIASAAILDFYNVIDKISDILVDLVHIANDLARNVFV